LVRGHKLSGIAELRRFQELSDWRPIWSDAAEGGFDILLENKVAVIYGAGGSIGGAVARAFAHEGARVFLAGHSNQALPGRRRDQRCGRAAETALVDALDERAGNTFVDAVAQRAGRIDISFNLIGYGDAQHPLTEMSVEDFPQPITTQCVCSFLTTSAAARHMVLRRSGGDLGVRRIGPANPSWLGGFKIVLDATRVFVDNGLASLGRTASASSPGRSAQVPPGHLRGARRNHR
jgi:NAD(P)-dependent dehydrogenase (short-subunit alcohol dehydrogenase family)